MRATRFSACAVLVSLHHSLAIMMMHNVMRGNAKFLLPDVTINMPEPMFKFDGELINSVTGLISELALISEERGKLTAVKTIERLEKSVYGLEMILNKAGQMEFDFKSRLHTCLTNSDQSLSRAKFELANLAYSQVRSCSQIMTTLNRVAAVADTNQDNALELLIMAVDQSIELVEEGTERLLVTQDMYEEIDSNLTMISNEISSFKSAILFTKRTKSYEVILKYAHKIGTPVGTCKFLHTSAPFLGEWWCPSYGSTVRDLTVWLKDRVKTLEQTLYHIRTTFGPLLKHCSKKLRVIQSERIKLNNWYNVLIDLGFHKNIMRDYKPDELMYTVTLNDNMMLKNFMASIRHLYDVALNIAEDTTGFFPKRQMIDINTDHILTKFDDDGKPVHGYEEEVSEEELFARLDAMDMRREENENKENEV